MSILIKAGAGLVAGMVAGGLGLVFFPRPEADGLKPRTAVEKPQFVLAAASQKTDAAPAPRATTAVALAAETPEPKTLPAQPQQQPTPSPVASASPAAKPAPTPIAAADPAKVVAPAPTKPAPTPASRPPVIAAVLATPNLTPETQRAAASEAPAMATHMASANDASASWSVRGLVAFAKGDLSSARVYLSRAADAGDPRALVALADTYDPAILTKLGVVGAPGDTQRAKDYLAKAAAAGVVVPKDRMAALDQNAH